MINKMNPAAAAEAMKDGGLTYGAGYAQLRKHAIRCASATMRMDPEISQWWRQVAECCWTKMSHEQRVTAWYAS